MMAQSRVHLSEVSCCTVLRWKARMISWNVLSDRFREWALLSLQCVMEGWGWIVHDGEQLVQWPPAPRWLTRLQVFTNDSPSLVNEFIDPAGTSGTDAAPPAGHSSWRSAPQTGGGFPASCSCIEGSKLPQKVESAHPLFCTASVFVLQSSLLFKWTTAYLLTNNSSLLAH